MKVHFVDVNNNIIVRYFNNDEDMFKFIKMLPAESLVTFD